MKHYTLHIAKPLQRRPLQTPASLPVHCQTKEALAHSSSSQSSAVRVVYNRSKLDKNTVPPSHSNILPPWTCTRRQSHLTNASIYFGGLLKLWTRFFFSAAWNIWPNFNLRQLVDGMRAAVSVSNDKTQKQKHTKTQQSENSFVFICRQEKPANQVSFRPHEFPGTIRGAVTCSETLIAASRLCVSGGRHCSTLPLVPGSTNVWMCEYNPPAIPQARAVNPLGDGSPAQTRLRSYVLPSSVGPGSHIMIQKDSPAVSQEWLFEVKKRKVSSLKIKSVLKFKSEKLLGRWGDEQAAAIPLVSSDVWFFFSINNWAHWHFYIQHNRWLILTPLLGSNKFTEKWKTDAFISLIEQSSVEKIYI